MRRLLYRLFRGPRGWPVPVPREPARPWAGQVPRVPPVFMTSSEWRSWNASQNSLPPVTIQGGQHGSAREELLARESSFHTEYRELVREAERLKREMSLRQAPPPSPAEQQQLAAARAPQPRRLTDAQQEAIRELNGRTPTYWEAVEIMGLRPGWETLDSFVGVPGKHHIDWMGVKLTP